MGVASAIRSDGRRGRGQRGFTLTEVLVTLTIAAVLAAIAVPNYIQFMANERQVSQANNLVFSLNFARSEAVKRDSAVCVCASADGVNCGTNWSAGWMVYEQAALTSSCSTVTTAVQVAPALPSNTALTAKNVVPAAVSTITFNSTGAVTGSNYPVTFKFCTTKGTSKYWPAQDVELTANGRAQAGPTPGYKVDGTTALTCP